MATIPADQDVQKCAWHPRRAAEHELLGLRFCATCARIALRAVVNQADEERVTMQRPALEAVDEPAQRQLLPGDEPAAPTPDQPL